MNTEHEHEHEHENGHGDFGDIPGDLGPPRGMKSSRRSIFRSPAVRIGLTLMVVVAGGVLALALWSSGQREAPESTLSSASSVTALPGTEAPPAYAAAVRTKNTERLQDALATGGSALPTPLPERRMGEIQPVEERTVEVDPVEAFREAITPPPPPPSLEPQAPLQGGQPMMVQQYVQPTVDPAAVAQAMQQQMQTLISGWAPQPASVIGVSGPTYMADVLAQQQAAVTPLSRDIPGEVEEPAERLVIPAGGRAYAQLETEANSDVPTPVVARILSGPLAGGRALGTFQSTGDYLVLEFNMVAWQDREYEVQAIAVDPNTQLAGMATETDQRYWQRIALPGAAAFLTGFARAASETAVETTVGDNFATESRPKKTRKEQIFAGVEETADVAADILKDEAAQIQPLVRVAKGTPMSILFLSSVREEVK
ncbi:MAG: hypothetical protein M3O22_00030 [Pseudomonadota bacterium]|nr:hypothetical protein [Pseudomonadota bacterium]